MTIIIILLIAVKLLVIATNLTAIGTIKDFNVYNLRDYYSLINTKARAPPLIK